MAGTGVAASCLAEIWFNKRPKESVALDSYWAIGRLHAMRIPGNLNIESQVLQS